MTICSGTAVIPPRFSASTFWPQVIKHKVTWYTAGTLYLLNLKAPTNIYRSPNNSSDPVVTCINEPH